MADGSTTQLHTQRMLIGGELVEGARTFPVLNPATEEVIGTAPDCDEEQLEEAICVAEEARGGAWAIPEGQQREYLLDCADAIHANAQRIGRLLTEEQGKPIHKAIAEVELAANWFRNTAALEIPEDTIESSPRAHIRVVHRPMGVVAAIVPWNYPIILAVCKVAPALRAGNTVVLKPSPFTPLATLMMGETLADVLPPGTVNIVAGGDDLGARLVNHPMVRKVSFTGSVEAGKSVAIASAAHLSRITLELGGNDAAIVLQDVDPRSAARGIFWGAFENSGQYCCAIKRLYLHHRIYDEVAHELVELARGVRVGNGLDPGTEMGPVSNAPQYERVLNFIADTKDSGGSFACGGATSKSQGYFVEPCLVEGLDNGARLVDEEQFGPVLPLIPFSNEREAIAKANDSPYGLGGSVWTGDLARAEAIGRQLDCGTVWINQHGNLRPDTPFGGLKSSGLGVEYGLLGLLEFMDLQVISALRSINSVHQKG